MIRPVTWDDVLAELEMAIAASDHAAAAAVDLHRASGPLPDRLQARASRALDGIHALEACVEARMAELRGEMDRRPSRPRWDAPPQPSHLDCSA